MKKFVKGDVETNYNILFGSLFTLDCYLLTEIVRL